MDEIINIKTISQYHNMLGLDKPKHPLITIYDLSEVKIDQKYFSKKISFDFYSIFIKKNCSADLIYGKNVYDFDQGVMNFMAPDQDMSVVIDDDSQYKLEGLGIVFHPDLIKNKSLAFIMKEYTFFSYNTSEALHLSEKEKDMINTIIDNIKEEIDFNCDQYSNDLIISGIELLLNYSKRFYGRQFSTREKINKSIIHKFEEFLSQKINSKDLKKTGIPTVKDCAEKMFLSPNYFSDLLKKETGKNTKEYIHFYLINRAKNLLLSSDLTINEIAFELGFEHPEYFSRLFKRKVGESPSRFRILKTLS